MDGEIHRRYGLLRLHSCSDVFAARRGVEHDDMSVIGVGGKVVGAALALDLMETFLSAHFSGAPCDRRRLSQVQALEHEES